MTTAQQDQPGTEAPQPSDPIGRVVAAVADKLSDAPPDPRKLAVERLKKKRDLMSHLAAFVVVNGAVWAIWAVTGQGYPWPAWMTGAWGIGLVLNWWDVYVRRPITEQDIEREMRRLGRP